MKTTLRISLAVWALSASIATAASSKPNILHIHADDHRPDGLRALGNEQLQTPHLDTLVKRGFVFTHCYTQGSMVGAVCLPSRTMLLTGRSLFHIPKPREGNPEVTLPRVIRSAGYETFHIGKGGNEYTTGLNAFDTNLLDDKGERADSSRRHANATVKFLIERDHSKPFYIYLAPPVPHDPRSAEPQFHKLIELVPHGPFQDPPLAAGDLPARGASRPRWAGGLWSGRPLGSPSCRSLSRSITTPGIRRLTCVRRRTIPMATAPVRRSTMPRACAGTC